MSQVRIDEEKGKNILREYGINFTTFKDILSSVLDGTKNLDEDDWVMQYNVYAGCVGRTGFESLTEWAQEFYQDHNKNEHRVWLKSKN